MHHTFSISATKIPINPIILHLQIYKTHMYYIFFLCFLTYLLYCEDLIYSPHLSSKAPLHIISQTPIHPTVYIYYVPHIYFYNHM